MRISSLTTGQPTGDDRTREKVWNHGEQEEIN